MLVGGQASLSILVIVLIMASIVDVKQHKIPNVICAFTALYGVAAHFYAGLGVLLPIEGMVLGLIIFLPFYIAGGMGAGDVKLMSAIGAILGLKVALAAGLTLVTGSFMSLFVLLRQPDGREALRTYGRMFFRLFRWHVWAYEKPQLESARAKQFPYAIAIAIGTLLAVGFMFLSIP
jgi:prepilin peptidase CpaA